MPRKENTIVRKKQTASYAHISKAWFEIGGKRFYSRSKLERNYARYLEFLKAADMIKDWEHEPETFWFEGIKRGTNNYKPDFKVTNLNDTFYFIETKGRVTSKDRVKFRRMKKYHPDVDLRLVMMKDFRKNVILKLRGLVTWE